MRNVRIGGKRFTLTELGSNGFSVGIRRWKKPIDKDHPIISSVGSIFNASNYSIAHTPIIVDGISFGDKFSEANDTRILDCPIKFPGRNEYRIPKALSSFDEAIAKAVSFEHAINPNVNDYYAYITVDQGYINAYECQRSIGCRANGFQGANINPKLPIARSYIAYDRVPPKFYHQGFTTDHLDEAKHNFFFSFDEQARAEAARTIERYNIVLTHAYTVYRNTAVDYPTYRTFFRLTYDVRQYDRFGNTHNNLFDYRWKMRMIDNNSHLHHKRLRDVTI